MWLGGQCKDDAIDGFSLGAEVAPLGSLNCIVSAIS